MRKPRSIILAGLFAAIGIGPSYIAITTFYLVEKIKFFVVFKIHAHCIRVFLNHGLIRRRIIAADRFRTQIEDDNPSE